MIFSFSHRKATQALNYFATQNGGSIEKLKALKLIYFADRHHLRKFGRPITNDSYLAMNFGPVASSCKDLAEMSDFLGEDEKEYAQTFLEPRPDHKYGSVSAVDQSVMSQTDLDSLVFAWEHYGRESGFDLADLTHQFPEWKRHEAQLSAKEVGRVQMSYLDFVENPPAGVDPMPALSEEEQQDLREELADITIVEKLWG